jgi:restriction system protein
VIPKFNQMYKEFLDAISDGEAHPFKEICDKLARTFNISDEERNIFLASGRQRKFDSYVSWTRAYLKAAGLIIFPQATFSQITDEGKKVLLENPEKIDGRYLKRYESYRNFIAPKAKKKAADQLSAIPYFSTPPSEIIGTAFSEINKSLIQELLSEILNKPPGFFEKLVVDLLVKMGYGSGIVTGKVGDGGIDGLIAEDKLGFSSICIQAKRYDTKTVIGSPEIQRFKGAILDKTEKGLFVTTAKFSSGAIDYAKEKHIVLIGGEKLARLMIEYDIGVSTYETYKLKKINVEYFAE